jgi:hypothetical protein
MKVKNYRVVDSFGKIAYSGGDKKEAEKVFLSCKWSEPHEDWRIVEMAQVERRAVVCEVF